MLHRNTPPHGVFLHFAQRRPTLLPADEHHEVSFLLNLLSSLLLLHVIPPHPDVDVRAFGPFDVLDQVEGRQVPQYLVEELAGEAGAFFEVFLGGGVVLDDVVDDAVVV